MAFKQLNVISAKILQKNDAELAVQGGRLSSQRRCDISVVVLSESRENTKQVSHR